MSFVIRGKIYKTRGMARKIRMLVISTCCLQYCYDLFTTVCCRSVHNSTAAVLFQQFAAGLFPTTLMQFCHIILQHCWRQSVAGMWRQTTTCRANASDMRSVKDVSQQNDNRPVATCAFLGVYGAWWQQFACRFTTVLLQTARPVHPCFSIQMMGLLLLPRQLY